MASPVGKFWKNGFLLGKFYPFHAGHAYLIEEAKKRCEHLVVLVACLPGDKEDFLEGKERYEAVKEHFTGYKDIEVRFHQDDDPQYPEEHPMFWNVWLKIILMNVDARQTNVIFSSERYGCTISRLLGIEHCMIDMKRTHIHISGTAVREDMFENWQYLPKSTQNRLMKKIAILGPESAGKSTLTKQLAEKIGCKYVPEYGREFVEQGGICDDRGFQKIALEQERRLKIAIEENTKPVIICDTEWVVTKVFYDMYTEKANEKIGVPIGMLDFSLFKFSHYDLRILLHPQNLEGIQDGTRNFLPDRLEHYNKLKNELDELGLPYVCIDSGEKALEKSLEIIQSMFGCKIT
jgi:NadR type nicotinamide-nucleotide adenylyltransferase